MRASGDDEARLVIAARDGDERMRGELIARHLPLLYNVVGRALDGHADTDDVVQETLLCVLRDLPALRSPESFRSWLVTIAMRQVIAYRRRLRAGRTAILDEAGQVPDGAVVEDEAIWRLHMSEQRRQVLAAARWLDPDYRALLALWWQEQAGLLTRAEVAAASGMTVAHAAVRLQRMREQLETARAVVAALCAEPRCPGLTAAASGWNGDGTALWRKRLARHVRDCRTCETGTVGRVPVERLLPGIAPLAAPAWLAAWAARTAGSPPHVVPGRTPPSPRPRHAPRSLRLGHAIGAHPLASAAAGVLLIGGATVATTVTGPGHAHPGPRITVAASPAPPVVITTVPSAARPSPSLAATGTVPLGRWSLESAARPGEYLTWAGIYTALGTIRASSPLQTRRLATFTVVHGLAERRCVSFIASNGDYLRHYELRLRLSPAGSTQLFREDTTFCPHRGAVPGSVTLQSVNYPYLVLRFRDGGIYIDVSDGTPAFAAESSFIVRRPWD